MTCYVLREFMIEPQNKTICECRNWAMGATVVRNSPKNREGLPILPNHHPNCQHYNDSLMDVWVVSDGTSRAYMDNEQDAKDTCDNEGEEKNTITKIKMHREVFENLPEFEGF